MSEQGHHAPSIAPRLDGEHVADGDRQYLRYCIRSLSKTQRAYLRRHAEAPQPIIIPSDDSKPRRVLLDRRLLRLDRPNFPRRTVATPAGRMMIAQMLADEAEALIEEDAS